MASEYKQFIQTGERAARAAGEVIRVNFGQIDPRDIQIKSKNDVVTFVDKEAEKRIVESILTDFPDHGILAEEGGPEGQDREFCWVVDPLDGTDNFIHGIPHFCTSIALLHRGNVVAGVIYHHEFQEVFCASLGDGAFLNGKPIAVSQTNSLQQSFGATAFPFRFHDQLPAYLQAFDTVLTRVNDLRRFGSAALDLAYTACGRYDFFWEAVLQPWDFLAGKIIVEEAGGKLSNFKGEALRTRKDSVFAANRLLFRPLFDLIKPHFSQI